MSELTTAQVEEAVRCHSVVSGPIPIKLDSVQTLDRGWLVTFAWQTRCRDTDAPIALYFGFDIYKQHPPERLHEYIYVKLRELWLHEWDEVYHFNRVRVFDPHKREEEIRQPGGHTMFQFPVVGDDAPST